MATKSIPSDTMTTMLLQERNSLRPVNSRALRPATGAISTSDEVLVTAAARRALERNLARLRVEQRAIPARLRVAREFGDMANNDEHLAIREEEAVLASRIARLEDILSRATEVHHAPAEESVTIGSTVTVLDVDTQEKLEYVIGSAHGVLSRGTVSALSPVGRALLGRRVGERAAVQLPHFRRRELELSDIRHPRAL
jgi:transcription elongation factor GreA